MEDIDDDREVCIMIYNVKIKNIRITVMESSIIIEFRSNLKS